MRTSERGKKHILDFEALKTLAYVDSAGHWTIGVGHTSMAGPPAVSRGMRITREEALEIFDRDLKKFEGYVLRNVKVKLTQGQFDALVGFTFNVGEGNLKKSTLLKRVNAKRFDEVPAQFMAWTKARDPSTGKLVELKGLVRRRRAEAALWRSLTDEPEYDPEETSTVPVQPQPKKSILKSKEGGIAILGGAAATGTAIKEVAEIAPHVTSITEAFGRWPVILAIGAAVLFAAIWYFRYQRNEEDVA